MTLLPDWSYYPSDLKLCGTTALHLNPRYICGSKLYDMQINHIVGPWCVALVGATAAGFEFYIGIQTVGAVQPFQSTL